MKSLIAAILGIITATYVGVVAAFSTVPYDEFEMNMHEVTQEIEFVPNEEPQETYIEPIVTTTESHIEPVFTEKEIEVESAIETSSVETYYEPVMESEPEFIVMSCEAIDEHTLMDKETGTTYDNPTELEVGAIYRAPAFNGEERDIIDIDTWETYLHDMTEYDNDLTRVEICTAIDEISLEQSDGNIFCIKGELEVGGQYYTFFDKMCTEEITDDRVIDVLPIDEFDVEIYELNKMYMEEND